MSGFDVDVVIPVHTPERPIARAVGSILDGAEAAIRVTVVCHNVGVDPIASALGDLATSANVRLLTVTDGIPSPAGPINAGLKAATAPFTALLDSDDTYDRGAVDAWLAVQRRDSADAVIPMLRYAGGASTRTPATRPFRRSRLDGVIDRLAYRSRLHGLVSRARFGDVRMTPGLTTGEDVIQGASVWYSDARISFARNAPGYRIHVDGGERTSAIRKPAADSLAFLDAVLADQWIAGLTPVQRESFAVKLLRTHVMDVLAAALQHGEPEDITAIASAVSRIDTVAPRARRVVSRRDARILALICNASPDLAQLSTELVVRTDFRRPDNVLPASAALLLHREAPLRFLGAVALSP